MPRIIGAYDVGRVINPKTARSQCIGGMVNGIGMALQEEALWDARFGRVMNANLAEYLVPVCADVQELEAIFVPSEDRNFNPLGVKGLAEVAICGVAPAIANAVFNATGRRIRKLPITPGELCWGEASSGCRSSMVMRATSRAIVHRTVAALARRRTSCQSCNSRLASSKAS